MVRRLLDDWLASYRFTHRLLETWTLLLRRAPLYSSPWPTTADNVVSCFLSSRLARFGSIPALAAAASVAGESIAHLGGTALDALSKPSHR